MPYLTENYNLKKPTQEETSDIDVINENMDVIDSELGHANDEIRAVKTSKCEVVFGTYTGDGAENRFINLGFTPVAVEVYSHWSYTNGSAYEGLALMGFPRDNGEITVAENGFYVSNKKNLSSNYSPYVYYFIAYKNGEIMEV